MMFFQQRSTLTACVLPLFISINALALPTNYKSNTCPKKPDEPSVWTITPVANTEQRIGQPMRWVMTITDADGELKFTKVRLRVVGVPADARSSSESRNNYSVLNFNGMPGTQTVTLDTPVQEGYRGYFGYISVIDFLDSSGGIMTTAAVSSKQTLNSGGIKGDDWRTSYGRNQINMAMGWHTDIAHSDYMFGRATPKFQVGGSITCDEHTFSDLAQGGSSEFSHNGSRFSGTAPTYYLGSMGLNTNWRCNYTLQVKGLKIADEEEILFDRRGFQPKKPWTCGFPLKTCYGHQDAYYNLRTTTSATGTVVFKPK